ncbi:polyprenyl synthetase family protein [Olivibacter sitiensis]|uniref:polyprenyl synthetase family protein n=1 Tax=Olivibacter sitiensis TaxID=376470 RepID=UPI000488E394|nr:polyprenyl synthetase family protein [Olivibacter sitiensis]
MSTLDSIKKPIATELDLFEKRFRASMKSNVPLLDRITYYIVKRKGKQMRPMFVFFSAGMCGGITDATHRGAALVELVHTATLVHDDVVDNSYQRRGFFSVNALWKNKVAVLVGDFLLSKGMTLSVENQDFEFLRILNSAVTDMSEGELLQMEKARRLDIDEQVYFDVIRKKTASLIASCCASGAASAGAEPDVVKTMHQLGEKIGLAFQIKDDLFDFGTDDIGKPKGIDIKEKKMTLPLIYALNQADRATKRHVIQLVKTHNNDNKKIQEVIDFVRDNGGLDYANRMMIKYQEEAFAILGNFPESVYRTGLEQLIRFTTERNK